MLLLKGTQAKYPFFRFIADALYFLTLGMTQNITKVINEEEKIMLETAALFIHLLCPMVSQVLHGYQSPLK
jgi:hypothetical protein